MDSLKEVIESVLFVAGEGVDFEDIASKLNVTIDDVKSAVKELQTEKQNSFAGIQVQVFNNKAQLCSNPNYAEPVSEVLNPIKEKALTKAVLEAAAIVAYKQPITRLEIEQVRGVNSDYAVNILIENNLIEVIGRKDTIGKPLLYGTTDLFLKRFNIESIESLPDYDDLLERIKIIKNPENSLFDYSNMPDSHKDIHANETEDQEPNVLASEKVSDSENELQELEQKIDKETINQFFNAVVKGELNLTENQSTQQEEAEDKQELNNEEVELKVKSDDEELEVLISATYKPDDVVSKDSMDLI